MTTPDDLAELPMEALRYIAGQPDPDAAVPLKRLWLTRILAQLDSQAAQIAELVAELNARDMQLDALRADFERYANRHTEMCIDAKIKYGPLDRCMCGLSAVRARWSKP